MRWSQAFIPTLRETPKDAEAISHQLMLRSGMIRQLGSGAYSYMPLGMRVLLNVVRIIRTAMDGAGAQECLLPALHPLELWRATGRDAVMRDVFFQITDRQGREMVLGPTHEEVMTDLVQGFLTSHKQLPMTLYQIQTKFRDEPRPKSGILRTKEFLMKDAYSFHADTTDLAVTYEHMRRVYATIFAACGLTTIQRAADPGAMGGTGSVEFLGPAACGEDHTPDGQPAIELGHIFQLGTKYTAALDVMYQGAHDAATPIVMGCYGIGVNRIVATAVEQHHDADGIIWPQALSPYDVLLVALDISDTATQGIAERLYGSLAAAGISVLYDDREMSAGAKFKDADLIGIPQRVVIGKRSAKEGNVECSSRISKDKKVLGELQVLDHLQKALDISS